MKNLKILLLFIVFATIAVSVGFAKTSRGATDFFNKYATYANTYNDELLSLYASDAKIIREVIKPDGQTEDVVIPTKRFFKELKIGQKTAKLRKYKNRYRNITVSETPNGMKISAERQPSRETYWLKMYQIVEDTDSGYKIKEEMMQTKVQTFLKHKDKGDK